MAAVTITSINDNKSTSPYTGVPYEGIVSDGGVTNDTSPTVSGTVMGAVGTVVQLVVNGFFTINVTTTSDAGGGLSIWSTTPSLLLGDGNYTFQAKHGGNSSTVYDITLDTSISTPSTIKAFDNFGGTTGFITNGNSSDDATPTLSGNADKNTTILIYDGGSTPIATTTANGGGNWSVELPTLSGGSHPLTFKSVDAAGNLSAAASFTVGVTGAPPADTTAPDTSITANPSTPTNSNAANFSFTGTDAVGVTGYEISLDGAAFTAAAGTSKSYTGLADGSHTFQVRAKDAAGNIDATPASYTWTVDTAAPDTGFTTTPASAANSTTANFSFSGNDGAGSGVASYQYSIDGGAFTAAGGSSKTFTGLGEGSHTVQVRATDNAGNTDPTPASYTWTVDTVAPDTTIGTKPAADSNSSSAAFTWSGNDGSGSGVASYEYSLDGGAFTAAGGGAKTFTGLGEGSHTLSVRAKDVAGNTDATPASYTWNVDTLKPAAPAAALTSDTGASGSDKISSNGAWSISNAEGGATVEYKVGAGAWTLVQPTATEGANSVDIRQTDKAGNVSDVTTFSFTLDTAAPDTTFTSTPAALSNVATAIFGFSANDGVGSGLDHYEAQIDGIGWLPAGSVGGAAVSVADGSHTLQIRAVDKAGNIDPTPASYTWVRDTTAPVFSSGGAAAPNENISTSTTVYTAAATDTNGVTLALSGADATKFDFDAATGKLTFKAAPDYETPTDTGADNVYNVTFSATDGAGNVTTKDVAISVADLNDKAPVFTSAGTATTAENTTPATVVYTAATTDADGTAANRNVTYTLEGADAAKFNINAASGAVTFKTAPNYEAPTDTGADNVYDVTVKATNVGVDSTQTTTKNVAISVTDVNDNTPVITSAATAAFAENGTGQAYKVIATDADISPAFNTITYSIEAGGDGALFNINSTTGVVTFKSSPNFEAPADSDKDNNYVLIVKASDGTFSSTKSVVLGVTNVFEPGEVAAGVVITSTDALIKDSSPLITGVANTSLVGQTVTVFEGATARGTGVVLANGSWSIETGVVADGAHTYTAQLAGNVSNSVTLTIDSVAPVVTITGTTGTGFSPTVAGTASVADVGRTVSILDGSTVVGTGTVGAGGAFSVTTGLTGSGGHSLTAQVTDLAGNVGASTATAYNIAPQPAQGQIDSDNLDTAYVNIMDSPSVMTKDAAFMLDLKTKLSLNLVTYKEALDAVIDRADGSTSVATLSYQFFTGKIPTKAGIDYLVAATGGNTTNINSAYYQDFNIENRYINFAVNLGHDGEGKAAFQTKYGALSLFDATKKAYTEIFGTAATDAKVHELLDTTITVGNLTVARSVYFQAYGHDDVGTKAAMVGWLLSEAAKSDVGAYAKANEAFLSDLADGATFGVDLIGVYGTKAIPAELLG